MKRYIVKITGKALADMKEIYDYIADELMNPNAVMGQYNRIADAVESMKMFPEHCRVFDTRSERDLGMRQIPVDNYTAVFVIQGDDVVALRVLYSASDINARLREDR